MKEKPRPSIVTEAQEKYLKMFPACAITGATTKCQAHHKIPWGYLLVLYGFEEAVKIASSLWIFITLTEDPAVGDIHCAVGHDLSFESVNLHIDEDAVIYKGMNISQIKDNPLYTQRVAGRPKQANKMNAEEIANMKAFTDIKIKQWQEEWEAFYGETT